MVEYFRATSDSAFHPAEADLSLALLFAGWAQADELQRRLAAGGHGDLRFADGLLFQHLVAGPETMRALAGRLEVTQQAVSKSVADLERRGYVPRARDPDDARARLVALTPRGEGAIGRRARTARRSRPSWQSAAGPGASRALGAC